MRPFLLQRGVWWANPLRVGLQVVRVMPIVGPAGSGSWKEWRVCLASGDEKTHPPRAERWDVRLGLFRGGGKSPFWRPRGYFPRPRAGRCGSNYKSFQVPNPYIGGECPSPGTQPLARASPVRFRVCARQTNERFINASGTAEWTPRRRVCSETE